MALLDFDLMKDEEENLEIVTALQSSQEGKKQYEQLCVKKKEFLNMVISIFLILLMHENFNQVALLSEKGIVLYDSLILHSFC